MTSEALEQILRSDVFLNTILGLAGILVFLRFFAFVIEVWRDGLMAHHLPCDECLRRLAPCAWFCPHCGHVRRPDQLSRTDEVEGPADRSSQPAVAAEEAEPRIAIGTLSDEVERDLQSRSASDV